jgi:hypothetical protein
VPRTLPFAALALALTCAGCGSTSSVGAARWVQVGETEYRLTPQHLRAHSGELAIVAHNYGRLTHNLALTSGGHTVAVTRPIAPGASASLIVVVAPGSYVMASTVLSDQDLGLYGTLDVTR